MPSHLLVFVSMFAPDPAGGIQAFHLDLLSGSLTPTAVTRGCPNGFFLAASPDGKTLYSLTAGSFGDAATEEVVAWRIADRTGLLHHMGRRRAGGAAACFLATDPSGAVLLVAHYSDGTVATLLLDSDGCFTGDAVAVRHEGSGPDPSRQAAPHPHAILAAPRAAGAPQFVLAADLGCDALFIHRLDAAGRLMPHDPPFVKTPPGSGPRHLAFHPDSWRVFVIGELANTIGVYDCDSMTGRLTHRQTVATLPDGFCGESTTADLKLTPDGRFLYGTNRGHDSIAVFRVASDGRLTLVEIVPSRGKGPQNIAITPDGSLLLCANMPGGTLAAFRISRETGRLTAVGEPVPVPSPSCLAIIP